MQNGSSKTVIPSSPFIEGAEKYFEHFREFQELMMRYQCAILEVETKLRVLNNDMSVRHNRNPIEFIKSRIKKPISIANKLKRRGLDVNIDNMTACLNDVAGIRVVCSFIDDIYEIAEMLARQDDITVIEVKDYIKNPKPTGYRSYHMIIEIPVFFSDNPMNMRVEVQIRTIAMDFWASLEHDLKYKNDGADPDIETELFECAKTINETDLRMQQIRDKVEKG
ncbi:MAG: GTP pyrophosphokinase family protein [Ruminococcaceae bacterium]|nr:GTP pyrophosphokinase family protein [Oscillospiraceae bacterium]